MRQIFVLCLLALVSMAGAQDSKYSETMEVRLHSLDAIVTDRDGKPVKGLTKDDFVLLENGKPVEITNFSFYDENASSTLAQGTGTVDGGSEAPATLAPPADAPPPRRFIFFIDEMSIQARARATLKKHALELLKQMKPGDLATIVRPTGTARVVQDYTSDVAAIEKSLTKALDDTKLRMTAPAFAEFQALRRALETAQSPTQTIAAKRTYAEAARTRVELRLGQLRALIASLSQVEGKKVLVLITSGLSARPGLEAYSHDEQINITEMKVDNSLEALAAAEASGNAMAILGATAAASQAQSGWMGTNKINVFDYTAQIDSIARTAAAEGVTIYTLAPEVPLFLNMSKGADAPTQGSTMGGGDATGRPTVPPEMLNQLLQYEAETMTSFAEKTGGKWFRGAGSIDDTFQQVASDLSTYYSLAYRATGDLSKPRKIAVQVKNRPELKVRARSEIIDRSSARDLSDRVLAELLYPRAVNDLKMEVKAEKPEKDGRAYLIPFEVVIPAERITFTRAEDGTYRGLVSVHYAAAREETEFLSYGRQEQVIELSARQYAELKRIKYRYSSSITVPKGSIKIALGVMDAQSKQTSLQTVSVVAR
ncbi:MAG TPA: VWA domain-containing protein [Thermoanaerobaculia bacterium]|nr:VWA domain-containing protein [Thermoanaerobaculia bacterium]